MTPAVASASSGATGITTRCPAASLTKLAHEFGGPWRVEKLKAYDLVHGEVAVGVIYECTSNSSQLAAQQVSFGYIAFWVAYFEVVPCQTP